jgi:DeoR/GlpR family transcriptional regulator of sugar metabolism
VDAARSVCVTADHTKWGVVGLSHHRRRWTEVDTLITDTGLSRRAVDVVSEHVDKIILAEVPTPLAAHS